ncbi:dihydrolipoyllysine-residue acetyltransferase [Malassezia furfur]|uniref:Dihydrolipoyllysine-residue acetyltransferase n=1 Tax=Malassezia furfur TaxID=55194 RepID=A0ABY8ESX2_MALFU|nr:dihydrolipoyllysine-residue acetyltransferase [Malassezia furfur]
MSLALTQETDKAMMDVEADDDGKMAKILVPSGTKDVEVNKLIAYLASPDDDLSSLELPDAEEAPKPSPKEDKPAPSEQSEAPPKEKKAAETHAHVSFEHTPLPSVLRLAEKYGIEHPEKEIKGTGLHGILTKGDVLAYLGKVKSPFGSASGKATKITDLGMPASKDAASSPAKKPSVTSLTPDEERDLILAGLVQLTSSKPAPAPVATFDTIMDAYKAPVTKQGPAPPPEARRTTAKSSLEQFYANLLG